MKVYLILIVLAALFCDACKHAAISSKKGYLLSIDQDKIGKPRDTVIGVKTYEFVMVPIDLSNFTKDTLKYMSMSCSWDVVFTIDKKTASIKGWACDNNFPTFRTVDPQKSFTYNLPILIDKSAITNSYTFNIGMYLFKYDKQSGFRDFDSFLDSFHDSKKPLYKNLIWSNEVTISK